MPTKVEEARHRVRMHLGCIEPCGCDDDLESAIREEERAAGVRSGLQAAAILCKWWIELPDAELLDKLEARAEGASEMVDESPQRRPPGTTADRMGHGAASPVALGRSDPSRLPSEEPEHSWTSCDDPFYRAPNPLYGSYERTAEHHREWHRRHPKKEPEPGGGRCPICNGSGDVLADNCPGDCDNGNGCRVTCKACDGTGKEREE